MKKKQEQEQDKVTRPTLSRKMEARRGERGAALIMTMVVLVMMSILVTGFLVSMRTEMVAANSTENIQRTKMVAQGAVSHAVNMLRANVPGPAPIEDTIASAEMDHWVVNPGLLTVFKKGGGPQEIPLHTGMVDSNPREEPAFQAYSVDLNRPLPGEVGPNEKPVPPITYALDGKGMPDIDAKRPEMWVKWVNVLKDPGKASGIDPDTKEKNEIIGRYGFWMDDECARINYNVASGKPDESDDEHNGRNFHEMLEMGMITPGMRMGSEATKYNESDNAGNNLRMWSLGSPRSINLDVLFTNKDWLLRDDLLDDTWLRGFNRYPEGLLAYLDIDGKPEEIEQETQWFREQRFNLTFYSRSPEFSPFGRSRLFTSRIPLSLEAGPLYQLPFVVAPVHAEPWKNNLHMHTLMGTFGFTDTIDEDEDGDNDIMSGNLVNRGQMQMLMDYLRRDNWPGYKGSFVDKYGEKECYQIALNILAMARNWTTGYNQNNLRTWSQNWFQRTSSVLYHPPADERRGENPERYYWRFGDDEPAPGGEGHSQANGETLIFPQTPGPHITEVRLIFDTEWNDKATDKRPRYIIKVRAEAELYAHPFCPPIAAWKFPVMIDYLALELEGIEDEYIFEFGRPGPKDEFDDGGHRTLPGQRNWNNGRSLGMLKVHAPKGENRGDDDILLPINGRMSRPGANANPNQIDYSDNPKMEEVIEISGVDRYIGYHPNNAWLKNKIFANNGGDKNRPAARVGWDPRIEPELKIKSVKVRFGSARGRDVGVSNNNPGGVGVSGRPRQMIPLGEYESDTLDLGGADLGSLGDPDFIGEAVGMAWEINDPLLSWDKNQWIGSAGGERVGSPGQVNSGTGAGHNDGTKFRYIPRGPTRFQVRKEGGRWHRFGRSDEYNSYTATASKGYWSLIRTGIQGSRPYETLDLTETDIVESEGKSYPPDFLLLEIMGSIYPMQHDQWKIEATLPDQFSTISYMNSTAGAINLNSRIFPVDSPYFEVDKFERRKPLEAVFTEMYGSGNSGKSKVESLVDSITNYQDGDERFRYIGELAKVKGYETGSSRWEKESLLRNLAGCLTTQSNTFGLWGVAQTVKKSSRNGKFDEFEPGDEVLGEKRFYAVIERYVWPGKDGVPGNAHADSSGKFDRVAKQVAKIEVDSGGWREDNIGDDTTSTFSQLPGSPPQRRTGNAQQGNGIVLDKDGFYPEYDGPVKVGMDRATAAAIGNVEFGKTTSLEEAYNPPQPVIKYRVAYFKYLDQ